MKLILALMVAISLTACGDKRMEACKNSVESNESLKSTAVFMYVIAMKRNGVPDHVLRKRGNDSEAVELYCKVQIDKGRF